LIVDVLICSISVPFSFPIPTTTTTQQNNKRNATILGRFRLRFVLAVQLHLTPLSSRNTATRHSPFAMVNHQPSQHGEPVVHRPSSVVRHPSSQST
jgi:hypothetical protein